FRYVPERQGDGADPVEEAATADKGAAGAGLHPVILSSRHPYFFSTVTFEPNWPAVRRSFAFASFLRYASQNVRAMERIRSKRPRSLMKVPLVRRPPP